MYSSEHRTMKIEQPLVSHLLAWALRVMRHAVVCFAVVLSF